MRLKIVYEEKTLPINIFQWTPRTTPEKPHTHLSYEIGLCLSGNGLFTFGNKCYEAHAGDLFIVNHREPHIAQSNPKQPSTYIFLNFSPRWLEQQDPELVLAFTYRSEQFRNKLNTDLREAARMKELILWIWEEWSHRPIGYQTTMKSCLLQICVSLMRVCQQQIGKEQWEAGITEYARAEPILRYIEENCRDDLTIGKIADKFERSPSQISRLLKEATGRRFPDYMHSLRIRHAKTELTESDYSIADICFGSGFQSMASFYRVFQQYTGLSPAAYRKRWSEQD